MEITQKNFDYLLGIEKNFLWPKYSANISKINRLNLSMKITEYALSLVK